MNNQLESAVWITTANQFQEISTSGQFSCVAVEINGTITAGNLKFVGTITGTQTPTLFCENVNGGGQVNGENTITAEGIYRCAPASLQTVRLVASEDFEGSVSVVFSASASLPPVAIIGLN